MKVAIVTHSVIKGDGQGRVNYELAHRFLSQGIDVHLIADLVDPDLISCGASWTPVNPKIDRIDLLKVWRFTRLANRVLEATAHDYDVIIASGVVLNRPHTVNVAHFVHGTWLRSDFHASKARPGINGLYQWGFSALNARWERQVFKRTSVVVAVSDMVRKELIEIGVPAEKLQVIVNGVDVDEFAPGTVDRKALGLPERAVLGLFVGDIQSPIKNLDTVLQALVDVPEMNLAVAGTIGQSPYPAMAEKLGVKNRVHFLGFRSDVAELMKAADLFLLPSRRDSCPLVLLEALASGLPVITAETVGTANLVESVCGFVLPRPDDKEELVRSMHTLAMDKDLRKKLGHAARMVAEKNSWQKMSAQYLVLLEKLVSRRSELAMW